MYSSRRQGAGGRYGLKKGNGWGDGVDRAVVGAREKGSVCLGVPDFMQCQFSKHEYGLVKPKAADEPSPDKTMARHWGVASRERRCVCVSCVVLCCVV